jgi:hypothetical protein
VSEKNTANNGGIGFCGLLTILLIALKLTGHIDWSWWWVWSPVWFPIVFLLGAIAIVVVGVALFNIATEKVSQWRGQK